MRQAFATLLSLTLVATGFPEAALAEAVAEAEGLNAATAVDTEENVVVENVDAAGTFDDRGSDANTDDGADSLENADSTDDDVNLEPGGSDSIDGEIEDAQPEESATESVEEEVALDEVDGDYPNDKAAALAAAATEDDLIASGELGECSWSLDSEGLLLIWPTNGKNGRLAGSEYAWDVPWYENRSRIASVQLGQGVSLPLNCSNMFYGCSSLASLDVSGWDTSSVRNMSCMFSGCRSLASLDVSSWDTSSVRDMSFMFSGCRSLASLDLSCWDTSNVAVMTWMFRNCDGIKYIRVGSTYVIKSSEAFPAATNASGWWSMADQRWYTVDEIVATIPSCSELMAGRPAPIPSDRIDARV